MSVQTPILVGKRVELRPVDLSDMELFVRWYNSPEVQHWFSNPDVPVHTIDYETQLFARAQEDDTQRDWIIQTLDRLPIGNAGLNHINRSRGLAELYIVIGEEANRSRGYGTEAVRLVLREAFDGLGLRRVSLYTDLDNIRAQSCYEKSGFVREGVLREHRLRNGLPIDSALMAILRSEWKG